MSSDGVLNSYQATQCYIAVDGNIHSHCCDYLNSHMENFLLSFLDVLLTVYLSIILVINQLNAQNLVL